MVFRKLRKKIARYFLDRKVRRTVRGIQSMNLKDAKSVGLIFHSRDEVSKRIAHDFAQTCRANKAHLHVLGFNHKRVSEENLISDSSHTYITKSDFSYFYQPKSDNLKEFINQPFDILLVIYPKNHIYIQSIVTLSKAKLIVGNEQMNHNYFGMSIDCDPLDVEATFNNAITYLSKITTQELS